MNSRDYRGGGPGRDDEGSRFREEERFRPGQGNESWRQRGGRTGGAYGDGSRFQGAETGAFGNPGGGYGEYNWERGGDFGARQGRGGEEYSRWGDEIGRGEYGGGDYGQYGREPQWGGAREREREQRSYGVGRESEQGRDWSGREGWGRESGTGGYGYGRGQGSMGSEGYGDWGAGYSGSGRGGSSGYGGGYGTEGYRTQQYGSTGQGGSREWRRGTAEPGRERGHWGKGPKGYQRSDERLREEVSDRLTDDPEVDASMLTVTVKDGEVTLEGTVEERFMKRRAEDVAESVSGVKQVHNKLRVENGPRHDAAEGGGLGIGTSVGTTGSASSSSALASTSAGATSSKR